MRFYTPLLATVLVSGMASAQTMNDFQFGFCGSTSYTSRHGVPAGSDGWATILWSEEHVRGAFQGDSVATPGTTVTLIKELRCLNQDQDRTTVEQIKLGIFLDDTANPGNPLTNFAGGVAVPVYETTYASPTATGTGAAAWQWVWTLATPIENVTPAAANFHFAGWMPANPLWSADGVSYHGSWFTSGTNGDDPGANAVNGVGGTIVNCTNSIDETAGGAVGTAGNLHQMRVWGKGYGSTLRLGADVDAASRHGNVANPNYGYAGLYPDYSIRADGMAFRAEDVNNANALGIILVSAQLPGQTNFGYGTGINPMIPGIGQVGDFLLDPISFGTLGITIPANLDAAGLFDQIVIAQGNILLGSYGRWAFQHVLIDSAFNLVFSNATGSNSL